VHARADARAIRVRDDIACSKHTSAALRQQRGWHCGYRFAQIAGIASQRMAAVAGAQDVTVARQA
jgi:hypothetical protein